MNLTLCRARLFLGLLNCLLNWGRFGLTAQNSYRQSNYCQVKLSSVLQKTPLKVSHVSPASEVHFTFDSSSPTSTNLSVHQTHTPRRSPEDNFIDGTHPCWQVEEIRLKSAALFGKLKSVHLGGGDRSPLLYGWEPHRADHRAVTYQCLTKHHQSTPSFNLLVARVLPEIDLIFNSHDV